MATTNHPENQQPQGGATDLGQISIQTHNILPIHGKYLYVPDYGPCRIEVEKDETNGYCKFLVRVVLEAGRIIYLTERDKHGNCWFSEENAKRQAFPYMNVVAAKRVANAIASHECPGCKECEQ